MLVNTSKKKKKKIKFEPNKILIKQRFKMDFKVKISYFVIKNTFLTINTVIRMYSYLVHLSGLSFHVTLFKQSY